MRMCADFTAEIAVELSAFRIRMVDLSVIMVMSMTMLMSMTKVMVMSSRCLGQTKHVRRRQK